METKLFRTVSVKDRLPEKAGWYNTTNGICQFNGDDFYETVTHWLEEFELPSEAYIIDEANYLELYPEEKHGFSKGANFVINHILDKNE